MKLATYTEHKEQVALMQWWRLQCKRYGVAEHLLFAIPNGGARNVVTGAILKAEGVRPGVPDLFLAVSRGPFYGMFIEMKRVHNGRLFESQRLFSIDLTRQGYENHVCYGWIQAKECIEEYMQHPPSQWSMLSQAHDEQNKTRTLTTSDL